MRFSLAAIVLLLPAFALANAGRFLREAATGIVTKGGLNQVRRIMGGWNPVKLNKLKESENSNLKSLASFGLEEAIKKDNSLEGYTVESIKHYWTQVVAGTNHKITVIAKKDNSNERRKVELVVYQPVGGQAKSLTSHQVKTVQTVKSKALKAAKGPLGRTRKIPGGWNMQNVEGLETNGKVQSLISFGLKELKKTQNNLQGFEHKKVLAYYTQVVAGTNHRITILAENANGEQRRVKMTIFEVSWKPEEPLKLTQSSVKDVKQPLVTKVVKAVKGGFGQVRQQPGGWKFHNLAKVDQEVLKFGVNQIKQTQNGLEGLNDHEVLSYWTQTVNGVNHKFLVKFRNNNGDSKKVEFVVHKSFKGDFTISKFKNVE